MASVLRTALVALFVLAAPFAAKAENAPQSEHVLGRASAPVKVDEYMSITCPHCAEFYIKTLPELEKRYVDTGKVRFIVHDFPLNGVSLKAAAVARCMPEGEYFPFIKTLYDALLAGSFGAEDSEARLYQYAALGGLGQDKAKACANDTKMQNEIIAERTAASEKYNIQATPTFIINDGAETINGAQNVDTFAAAFDRQLKAKH